MSERQWHYEGDLRKSDPPCERVANHSNGERKEHWSKLLEGTIYFQRQWTTWARRQLPGHRKCRNSDFFCFSCEEKLIHRPYLMLCIVSEVGIGVVWFVFFPLYPLCSHIAQLLVDRAISYPPELGNTMVSLCSKTLPFNTKDKKVSAICPQFNSSLHSSESGSQNWSLGRFRSGPENRTPTEAPRRAFQNPSVSSSSFCEITGYERCFKRLISINL